MFQPRLRCNCILLLVSLLVIKYGSSIDLVKDPGSTGCYEETYRVIICSGNNINISEFLRSVPADLDPPKFYFPRFKRLKIIDTNLSSIEENTIKFYGYDFEDILISNAPKLQFIHPSAFASLKNTLADFRAISTSLPDYNYVSSLIKNGIKNPFDGFNKLLEIFVSAEDSYCPSLETISPCKCTFGGGGRKTPSGLYGDVWSYDAAFPNTTELTCHISETFTVENFKALLQKLHQSPDFIPKRFDVLHLSGSKNFTHLPEDFFGGITFTTIWMSQMSSLKFIHPLTFGNTRKTIQILEIDEGNFIDASDPEVKNIFTAFSSLTNVRILRINKAGIPYLPSHAFEGEMENLRSMSISFDRRKHENGVRSIGSYAFAGASNLRELGLIRNFIEKFEPYSFAFNKSSVNPLTIEIGTNPFNDKDGLEPDAWSGANRPLLIKYEIDHFGGSDANDPSFNYIPESVFKPFFEENSQNTLTIDYYNVDIWCNENSSWLFEQGLLKDRVSKGIRVKRIEENVVASEASSIQCKPESSFKGLPHCLGFPTNGLLHCGGEADKSSSVRESLRSLLCVRKNFKTLLFSTKGVTEFPSGALEDFEITRALFHDSSDLSRIHPNAFGSLTLNSLYQFAAFRTKITSYPNFGMFPNLTKISLDDSIPYSIQSFNFDYSNQTRLENPKEITVQMDYGSIEPNTFSKLNNGTNIRLIIGKRIDCSTLACVYGCQPSSLLLEDTVFRKFLEANLRNKLITTCHVNCSCHLNWLYNDWEKFQEHQQIRLFESHHLYCKNTEAIIPQNRNSTGPSGTNDDEELLTIFSPKGLVDYKTYSDANCN